MPFALYMLAQANMGAATGPALGALGLVIGADALGPVWVAVVLTAVALVVLVLSGPVVTSSAPAPTGSGGPR